MLYMIKILLHVLTGTLWSGPLDDLKNGETNPGRKWCLNKHCHLEAVCWNKRFNKS